MLKEATSLHPVPLPSPPKKNKKKALHSIREEHTEKLNRRIYLNINFFLTVVNNVV